MQGWMKCAAAVTVSLLIGCTTAPPPRAVYHDPTTALAIQQDSKAGPGHNHPAQISPEVIQQILDGVRIQSRKAFLVPSLITGGPQFASAFSKDEQTTLAPHLSRALAEAKPEELVTFYRRVSTPTIGLAITSGGLFVHDKYLYVILANARTLPSESMREGLTYEIDPVDNPLLPISRTSFRATFVPATSMVPEDEHWVWPYIDQGRVVVIDLVQLGRDMRSPAPPAVP
jgi:hypothetical protein